MKPQKASFRTIEEMVVGAAEMVRPPEQLSVSEAAERYHFLDNPGSFTGFFSNSKTPYLQEPMDEMNSLDYTGLIFVGPARTGKSNMFFNWLTHTVVCDPADMIIYHMTKDVARDWSIGDLDKMLRNSKDVGSRLLPGRHNSNVHDKRFKSGMRLMIKWPTITELSGKTVPRVFFADYDRFENADDVAKEGPAFDLGRKRTASFKRFGMTVAESSPGREVLDPKWVPRTPHEAPPTTGILSLYNRGDRRRRYWKCLCCQEAFEPDFSLFHYPDSQDMWEAAQMVTLRCPWCRFDHEPSMKTELDALGKWIKDGQRWHKDGSITGKPIRTDIASFWLKGPPAVFQSWENMVFQYLQAVAHLEATDDEGPLKKTVTADQGNAYVSKAKESDRLPEELKDRAQDWGGTREEPVVPEGARFLVGTVDVQAGSRPSFVVQVHGIGVGGDTWIVDMFKIRKSERLDEDGERHPLDPAAYPEDWDVLIPQVLQKTYPLADDSGRRMMIKMVGCDSGGREGVTTNAYNFWRRLRDDPEKRGLQKRFQLVKGDPNPRAPRVTLRYPDSQRKDRHSGARGDVPVLFIHSDQMKDKVSGMLGRVEPGNGMIHFPWWAEDWLYTQLTAEVRGANGKWDNPRSKRNEAFDLLYYCLAICVYEKYINLERINWQEPPGWARDWDHNDLVFSEGEARPFSRPREIRDLAALAAELA